MNRRQKIIVSVTGIFIVLLALVGLTYAYFLTQITDNQNPTSISVTTKNMVLEYGEETSVIQGINNAEPGYSVEKTFRAINKGDATSYVVVLENVVNGLTRKQDLVYTLTCESVNTETGAVSGTCNGETLESTFPSTNDSVVLIGNDIAEGITHNYKLTVTYKEAGVDQSVDMNKTFSAKVNIMDIKSKNPYSANKKLLTYNIINNSIINKNGTLLVSKPVSVVGTESISNDWEYGKEEFIYPTFTTSKYYFNNTNSQNIIKCIDGYDDEDGSWSTDCSSAVKFTTCTSDMIGKYIVDVDRYWDENNVYTYKVVDCDDDKIVIDKNKFESILAVEEDDYGNSYYYRGAVKDNYINFAGMCWRIVRIDGNGNVKLSLEDKNYECDSTSFNGNYVINQANFGYTKYEVGTLKDSNGNSNTKVINLMDYLEPKTSANNSMVKKFYDFQSTLSTKIGEKYNGKLISDVLKAGDWCMDNNVYLATSGTYGDYNYTLIDETQKVKEYISSRNNEEELVYGSYARSIPTFKCNGKIMSEFKNVYDGDSLIITESPMYVSTLTNDEFLFAGGVNYYIKEKFYLIDNQINDYIWTLSPSLFNGEYDAVFHYDSERIDDFGDISYGVSDYLVYVSNSMGIRPSVILKDNMEIVDGSGTQKDPYVIG